MEKLDINEVAHRPGIPASTLRFYEAKGLIASIVVGARFRRTFVCSLTTISNNPARLPTRPVPP